MRQLRLCVQISHEIKRADTNYGSVAKVQISRPDLIVLAPALLTHSHSTRPPSPTLTLHLFVVLCAPHMPRSSVLPLSPALSRPPRPPPPAPLPGFLRSAALMLAATLGGIVGIGIGYSARDASGGARCLWSSKEQQGFEEIAMVDVESDHSNI